MNFKQCYIYFLLEILEIPPPTTKPAYLCRSGLFDQKAALHPCPCTVLTSCLLIGQHNPAYGLIRRTRGCFLTGSRGGL
jgi:hypothetical protein